MSKKSRRNQPANVAFCAEHGLLDRVDEDGLCPACGATSMGDAIDKLWAEVTSLRKERARRIKAERIAKRLALAAHNAAVMMLGVAEGRIAKQMLLDAVEAVKDALDPKA